MSVPAGAWSAAVSHRYSRFAIGAAQSRARPVHGKTALLDERTHLLQECLVRWVLGELLDERLHRRHRVQGHEAAAQEGDAAQDLGGQDALLLARAGLREVHGREDAAV